MKIGVRVYIWIYVRCYYKETVETRSIPPPYFIYSPERLTLTCNSGPLRLPVLGRLWFSGFGLNPRP